MRGLGRLPWESGREVEGGWPAIGRLARVHVSVVSDVLLPRDHGDPLRDMHCPPATVPYLPLMVHLYLRMLCQALWTWAVPRDGAETEMVPRRWQKDLQRFTWVGRPGWVLVIWSRSQGPLLRGVAGE